MKKKILTGAMIVAVVMASSVGQKVEAWGPERTLFTNEKPATYPTFNSITDNAAVGDERDFVRVVEVGAGKSYTNQVTVYPGKEYQVYIYYHNNASATFNTEEKNYSGVAREVKLAAQFPAHIEKGEKGTVSAVISGSNTNPAKVWDEAYLTAGKTVDLKYKVGSAKIFNDWGSNGSVLSTNLFSSGGTYLGLNELNGVILGCDEYSGQVVYTLVAEGDDGGEDIKPDPTPVVPRPDEPTPTPEPTPDEPIETPSELPKTGPAEIALASFIILGLVAWGIYYSRTRKNLKRVRASVMGKEK